MHATVIPVRKMLPALMDIQTRNISVIVILDIPENTVNEVKTQ